jgi:hypothetical protein
MPVDDLGDDVGEIGVRFDTAQLAGFDQRRDDSPVLTATIRRDLMMPGVWATRWRSRIRFTRCLGAQRWLSPISSTMATGI